MPGPKRGTYRYFFLLIALCAATTALAGTEFAKIISRNRLGIMNTAILTVFVVLFFCIAIGFWTATFGFIRGILARSPARQTPPPSDNQAFPKTAILMPIYNEDVISVFTRLQVMVEALTRTDQAEAFDFFILSDSTDPDIWLEEELAWASLRAAMKGHCGLYYRRRTDNAGHKSGNIQDFCKHWGDAYRYMITLDADSLMTEQAFVEMVRRMENDPRIGILQSLPAPVNRRSLFGRLQQFAAQMYGPIFTSGYTLWSQMEGTYWGHNAIIRVRAFMESCGLPMFPGSAPLGGEILSHDFVEAAFILKQGWKVVVHDDIPGSYEECPANLIDFAKRDQRWCQGNLQHIRLVFQQKLRGLSRAQLGMGAMSYLSSPLWAIFLVLIALAGLGLRGSAAVPDSEAMAAVGLFVGTMLLLMLPKVWALFLTMNSPTRIAEFGGPEKAIFGVLFEIAASIVIAPILMAFHTTFVTAALLGHCVRWEVQPRTDHRVMLAEAFRIHAWHTIAGLSAALLIIGLSPAMFFWILPVLLPLVLSVPISMLLGSQRIGGWLLKHGMLVIPQERRPPELLQRQQRLQQAHTAAMKRMPHPFSRVVLIPAFNALHIALLPEKIVPVPPERMDRLKRIALTGGSAHLSKNERKEIISDAAALEWLHRHAWKDWPMDLIERCEKTVRWEI